MLFRDRRCSLRGSFAVSACDYNVIAFFCKPLGNSKSAADSSSRNKNRFIQICHSFQILHFVKYAHIINDKCVILKFFDLFDVVRAIALYLGGKQYKLRHLGYVLVSR